VDEQMEDAERETARRIEILGAMHKAIESGLAVKGDDLDSQLVV